MKQTFEVINRMREEGVIDRYALGGAVAATFYLEPFATLDIDIFISFPNVAPDSLISLERIYSHLRSLGYHANGEHVEIEGWPVQFLPADDPLYNEALVQSLETDLDGVRLRIMSAEHLIAIALRTGRAKDFARISQFVGQKTFDPILLDRILSKHGLIEKWRAFQERFGAT
jgi:hypothetical protein